MKQHILLIIMAVVVLTLIRVTSVQAQQITLSINPPIVEAILKPGKSILVGYTVTNSGDPATIRFKMRTFSPQGTSGALHIADDLEGPVRFSLDNSDLQLEQPFLARTGAYRQAVVRMRIPEGTPDGDYYYILLAETESTPGINGSSGSISKASIGSPLLITVTASGKVQIKGGIESMQITPRYILNIFNARYQIVDSSDSVPVRLTLTNQGSNLFKPEGTITVSGGLGETIVRTIIPQNILANSSRTIKCTPNCTFSSFFIGRYDIKALVRLNEKQPPLTASTTFVGIPFRFILGMFLAVIIMTGLFFRGKKKKKIDTLEE